MSEKPLPGSLYHSPASVFKWGSSLPAVLCSKVLEALGYCRGALMQMFYGSYHSNDVLLLRLSQPTFSVILF